MTIRIMVDTITKAEDVKILVKQDIDPTDLDNALMLADKQLVAILGMPLENVQTTDSIYGALEAVGAAYAAWQILFGWDKDMYFEKAKALWTNYITQLENFRKLSLPENLTDPQTDIYPSEYTIAALNPNEPHFMSTY